MARGKRKKRETIREMQPDEAALRIMEWTDPELDRRPEEPEQPAAADDEPDSGTQRSA